MASLRHPFPARVPSLKRSNDIEDDEQAGLVRIDPGRDDGEDLRDETRRLVSVVRLMQQGQERAQMTQLKGDVARHDEREQQQRLVGVVHPRCGPMGS